ncbi:GyrI-like domain-containing protein [Bacillus sp. CGMCC 1.16607]|uniref:GyrI-like domain-containing protein n=1 Tax=Bacillus sp. CGMCC 1.16607 TaxID=3351842 RepID=UPI00363983CB
MNYIIVELEAKMAIGLTARTNNLDPNLGNVIGNLWGQFYRNGINTKIQNKKTDKVLGIYSDYAGNEQDDYNVTVACEVEFADTLPVETVIKELPAGKYAKFIVEGHVQKAVSEFWQSLWSMNLERTFVCDFEEYQNSDMENAIVHIYIGLK